MDASGDEQPQRNVRLRFRAPEHVPIAAAAVEKICEGLDVPPEARAEIRERTEAALTRWIRAAAGTRPGAEPAPVELVIDVEEGKLRLELRSDGRTPYRLVIPVPGPPA